MSGSGNTGFVGDTVTIDSGDVTTITIDWNTTSEFGSVSSVKLCKGRYGSSNEECFPVNGYQWYDSETLDDPLAYPFLVINEDSYFRVEAYTTTGQRAYTNLIKINAKNISDKK